MVVEVQNLKREEKITHTCGFKRHIFIYSPKTQTLKLAFSSYTSYRHEELCGQTLMVYS